MGKGIQLLIGILVSGATLYLAFKDVDVAQLKSTVASISLWPIAPFLGLWIFHYIARAWRWRYLLPTHEGAEVPIRSLFDSIILGNLASFVLPFRLGEFIRPLILSRWSSYTFASGFASVVIERFFDLAAVLFTLAAIVPFLPELPKEAVYVAGSLGVLAAGLLVFMVVGCLIPNVLRKVIRFFTNPFPAKLKTFANKFSDDLLDGAAVVATVPRLAMILSLSVVVWASSFAQFYVLLWLFPEPFSVLLSLTIGVLVALFVAAPSTPGFVGVFQGGCVAAAALVGYPIATAQAYSLVVHVLIYITIIAFGFTLLAVHDLSLGELRSSVGKKSAEEPRAAH